MALTFEETSRSVDTASGTIHFHEAGPADGPAVIMLHGSGPGATGWSNFNGQLRALAHSFRVIAPDMPGWGESDPVTRYETDHPGRRSTSGRLASSARRSSVTPWVGPRRSVAAEPRAGRQLITLGAGSPGGEALRPGGTVRPRASSACAAYLEPARRGWRSYVDILLLRDRFKTPELVKQRSDNAKSTRAPRELRRRHRSRAARHRLRRRRSPPSDADPDHPRARRPRRALRE